MKKIYFLMLMIFISISTFAQQVTKEEFDQWLREANQGNAVSQRKVGICYERGYNVLQDNTKAVEWYQKAANQGDAIAQCLLGICYYLGKGVIKNYSKAVEWYQKAANQGLAGAQDCLGDCYYRGNGVTQNYTKAVEWYQKAANQGYASAQCHLGTCYEKGNGVTQNYTKAVEWYQKAANQGDASAQCHLGTCYYAGLGITKNYAKAVEWYQKAANQGNDAAQCLLGMCYQHGDGVTQNYAKAIEWYQKAARQGHNVAIGLLKSLNSEIEHTYVDLGLSSGTLWATCNIGAMKPEDDGDYFAWGETDPKSVYDWSTHKYMRGSNRQNCKYTKYCPKSENGYNGFTDNLLSLKPTDDAASSNWGKDWCMPTALQLRELKEECKWTLTTKNGKKGYDVKGPNGNSMFLPLTGLIIDSNIERANTYGYLWSKELYEGIFKADGSVSMFYYTDKNSNGMNYVSREVGYPVRAVRINNKHAYKDLGLPSGTLWATCNIGATIPAESGDYFAWGEINTKTDYSWSTYKYANNDYQKQKKYCTKSDFGNNGFTDGKKTLDYTDDAAYQIWGSDWCMPTEQQIQELIDNCEWTSGKQSGKNGVIVTGPNGATLFFPATGYRHSLTLIEENNCGYYWTRSLYESAPGIARRLCFDSSYIDFDDDVFPFWDRYYGLAIRPVRRK